jgi:hypothetical protein
MPEAHATHADRLNRTCACSSLGAESLARFYSQAPVFITAAHQRQMIELVESIYRVIGLPAFQRVVLGEALPVASVAARTHGVFAGFDFHIGAEGPKLIEINTNAGGAMLNAAAEWRHPDCCGSENPSMRVPASRAVLEDQFAAMFRNEWRLARGELPLKTLAIVDDQPEQQFLFPEFQLFQQMLSAHGIGAFIVDAAALEFSGGQLRHGEKVIDLVYNRVTDFYFEEARHRALREAYEQDAAVITPHPRVHALFADKRNLVRLTDEGFLRSIGVLESDIARLMAGIPRTQVVEGCSERWWQDRKGWFFKPSHGFGSRGAYRGDKITRRAFGEVVQGGYVAQQLAMPGERLREGPEGAQLYKVDIRCYVYDGVTQLLAARLYQGQTTNFRTAGGGSSPVIELLDV